MQGTVQKGQGAGEVSTVEVIILAGLMHSRGQVAGTINGDQDGEARMKVLHY
jgi:hypothetical protein